MAKSTHPIRNKLLLLSSLRFYCQFHFPFLLFHILSSYGSVTWAPHVQILYAHKEIQTHRCASTMTFHQEHIHTGTAGMQRQILRFSCLISWPNPLLLCQFELHTYYHTIQPTYHFYYHCYLRAYDLLVTHQIYSRQRVCVGSKDTPVVASTARALRSKLLEFMNWTDVLYVLLHYIFYLFFY